LEHSQQKAATLENLFGLTHFFFANSSGQFLSLFERIGKEFASLFKGGNPDAKDTTFTTFANWQRRQLGDRTQRELALTGGHIGNYDRLVRKPTYLYHLITQSLKQQKPKGQTTTDDGIKTGRNRNKLQS
jgi:hypothetical protein